MQEIKQLTEQAQSICFRIDHLIENNNRLGVNACHEISIVISNIEKSLQHLREINEYYGI